jgi:hypothetical protein
MRICILAWFGGALSDPVFAKREGAVSGRLIIAAVSEQMYNCLVQINPKGRLS